MNRLWWLCFAVLVAAPEARSQRDFPPDIFDTRPVALDPAHFRLVLENDQVQVIRVLLGPREKTMVMEVPAHVMTCLTDQHVRVIYAHDKPAERWQKAGYSGWLEREEYGLENLSDKPAEWILVVPKTAGRVHDEAAG